MTIDAGALLSELVELPNDRQMDRLRAAGDPEALLLALVEETDRRATEEIASALDASALLVALADDLGAPRPMSGSRRSRATILAYAGRYEEALAESDAAWRIAGEHGLAIEAGRARLASVQAFARLGRFDEALAAGQAARGAFATAGDAVFTAKADLNLGAVHDMRDDPEQALIHYDRARPGLAGDPAMVAQLETNRGTALMALDRFEPAEAAFRAAVAAFAEIDFDWAAAIAEGNLAFLATRQGRLERALHHFERARRRLEVDEAPADLAGLLAEQADAMAALGMAGDALSTYERVLPELEASGLAFEAAQARAGLGRVALRLGRLAEAESALAMAAADLERLGQTVPRARLDLVRAELAAERGMWDEARALSEDALEALAERPVDAAVAREHLARYEFVVGNHEAAQAHANAAMRVAERLDIAPIRAGLFHTLGLVKQANGDRSGALADLRAAVEQLERVRGTLQSDRFRTAFVGDRVGIYEDAIRVALDGDDEAALAEAFELVERAKGRALLDLVAGALDIVEAVGREAIDPAEASLLAALTRVRGELNWYYGRLGDDDAGESEADTRSSRRTRLEAIHRLEAELDALDDRLAAARGVAGLYAPPLGLADALHVVPPGSALIEYFSAGGETIAFVLKEGKATVARRLAQLGDLDDRVRRVRFQIGRASAASRRPAPSGREARMLADVRREFAGLYDLLIRPLRGLLDGVDCLLIVPHGTLHTLPFGALYDGERYLIEAHDLVYAPSVSVLARLQRPAASETEPPTVTSIVVGVPDALAPSIEIEAERVAQRLGGQTLLGEAATAERVMGALPRADIVHLACHGRFSPDRPLASGLKLADRWLTVRDVYTLRLRASLVTLSGCETGRAAMAGGDEIVGLVRGFLAAGAASLVFTLWVVDDESTADLMADFYDAYRGGSSAASALRSAQCSLLKRRPHPAFWAPFVLGGSA